MVPIPLPTLVGVEEPILCRLDPMRGHVARVCHEDVVYQRSGCQQSLPVDPVKLLLNLRVADEPAERAEATEVRVLVVTKDQRIDPVTDPLEALDILLLVRAHAVRKVSNRDDLPPVHPVLLVVEDTGLLEEPLKRLVVPMDVRDDESLHDCFCPFLQRVTFGPM